MAVTRDDPPREKPAAAQSASVAGVCGGDASVNMSMEGFSPYQGHPASVNV